MTLRIVYRWKFEHSKSMQRSLSNFFCCNKKYFVMSPKKPTNKFKQILICIEIKEFLKHYCFLINLKFQKNTNNWSSKILIDDQKITKKVIAINDQRSISKDDRDQLIDDQKSDLLIVDHYKRSMIDDHSPSMATYIVRKVPGILHWKQSPQLMKKVKSFGWKIK